MLLGSRAMSPSPVFVRCTARDVADRVNPNTECGEAPAPSRGGELLEEVILHLVAMKVAQVRRCKPE
jgi:hypothetical protein